MKDLQQPIELITIEEFASRLGVSRTTVFEWIKSGILRPGRHFIKIGRISRFPWGEELLKLLLEDSQETQTDDEKQQKYIATTNNTRAMPGIALDLDYR